MIIKVDGKFAAEISTSREQLVPQNKWVWAKAYHRIFPKSTIEFVSFDPFEGKEITQVAYLGGEK